MALRNVQGNRFVLRKDEEIQQVCNHYYQQFIQSNQELVGVKADIGELKQAVLKLNADIQSAGNDYLRQCQQLVMLRRAHERRSTPPSAHTPMVRPPCEPKT